MYVTDAVPIAIRVTVITDAVTIQIRPFAGVIRESIIFIPMTIAVTIVVQRIRGTCLLYTSDAADE